MGVTADAADHPADTKPQITIPRFYRTVIITMNGEASGMTAGAEELMELKIKNDFIIKILRNRVAYIDR